MSGIKTITTANTASTAKFAREQRILCRHSIPNKNRVWFFAVPAVSLWLNKGFHNET